MNLITWIVRYHDGFQISEEIVAAETFTFNTDRRSAAFYLRGSHGPYGTLLAKFNNVFAVRLYPKDHK